jgi:hypothetical protein
MPTIPSLGSLKQLGLEFKANQDYRARPCLKKKKKWLL